MYLRTIKRKNKDGSVVEYVQLAHNVRHPVKGYSKAEVIYSFGRREQLDIAGLKRLVSSISRFIELDETKAAPPARPGLSSLSFVRSLPVGGIIMLHALWDRFGIDDCLQKGMAPQSFSASSQSALFAMVAKSALAPFGAGLTTEQIVSAFFFSGQHVSLEDRHFDQAIGKLYGRAEAVQQAIFRAVANHLNIDVDQIYIHLISACAMIHPDESVMPGHDRRALPQPPDVPVEGTIGLAVSQAGIPIGCWLMPGNTIDTDGIQAVEEKLSPWSPRQVVWVMDRLVTGDHHSDALQQSGRAYILGQKLRDSGVAVQAKTPKGRFKILGPDLQIKTQIAKESSHRGQWVIAYHPEQAAIDRKARQQYLRRLRVELDNWNALETPDQVARFRRHPDLVRYLKIPKGGTPGINRVRVRQDEKYDGKYLLISNDNHLPPETVAWGHKQLLEFGQRYRELMHGMKTAWASSIDGLTDAGMLPAWLILLFRRVAELQAGMPWENLCREMQALQLGEFANGNHRIFKYTALTARQKKILQHMGIDLPQVHPPV